MNTSFNKLSNFQNRIEEQANIFDSISFFIENFCLFLFLISSFICPNFAPERFNWFRTFYIVIIIFHTIF
jgi:hypothetical protein